MVRILDTKKKDFEKKFQNLLEKRDQDDKRIDSIVSKIIDQVRTNSDNALVKLTKEFGWKANVDIDEGLKKTIDHFKNELNNNNLRI